jgi:hypothetical protein
MYRVRPWASTSTVPTPFTLAAFTATPCALDEEEGEVGEFDDEEGEAGDEEVEQAARTSMAPRARPAIRALISLSESRAEGTKRPSSIRGQVESAAHNEVNAHVSYPRDGGSLRAGIGHPEDVAAWAEPQSGEKVPRADARRQPMGPPR